MRPAHIKTGLAAGAFNALGFILQTIGAGKTTLSNNAFLTTTNVVMVPFIAWIFLKKKPHAKNFAAITVCMLGTAVLAGVFENGLTLNTGDIYSFACAFCYASSIVVLSNQSDDSHFASGAFMMGITHFAAGLMYFIIVEKAQIPSVNWKMAILPILYLGVGSSFAAQTLQVACQKYVNPTVAAQILMLESVWGSIDSILMGFEKFTADLVIGGALIIISLRINEADFKGRKNRNVKT